MLEWFGDAYVTFVVPVRRREASIHYCKTRDGYEVDFYGPECGLVHAAGGLMMDRPARANFAHWSRPWKKWVFANQRS